MMSVHDFREALKDSELLGCVCCECGKNMLPPRLVCCECGSTELEEHRFEGKGVIKTITIVRVPLTRFKELCPYGVGIIELDEGPMITGMIIGDLDKLEIGDQVEAVYLDEGEEKLLAFKAV
jgi:uncharacterized OB-fold protein